MTGIATRGDVLKAAGTPMIKPLPVANSFDRSILVPGEVSASSTEGSVSPTLTMFAIEVVKVREVEVVDLKKGRASE